MPRRMAAAILLCGIVVAAVHGQIERRRAARVPEPEFTIGVFGSLNSNIHSGDFVTNRSTVLCDTFQSGAGAGPAGGLEMSYNFSPHYAAMLRLGYGNYAAAFVSSIGQITLIDSAGIYKREHVWNPTLTYGTAEVLFNFSPISRRIQFMVGPTVSFNLGKQYTEDEQIVTASGGKENFPAYTFPNGSNVWTIDQGNMPNIRPVIFGAEIGMAVEFRLLRNLLLAPNAYMHYFLQSPSTQLQWTVLTFRLGVSLRYVASYAD